MPGLEPGIQGQHAEAPENLLGLPLASGRNGTLYIGVTSNIAARVYQHKEGLLRGFTKKYSVTRLVHCEPFESISYAIQREKTLKKWPRKWKLELIERDNPQWRDIAEEPLW